jgi:NTE family protein
MNGIPFDNHSQVQFNFHGSEIFNSIEPAWIILDGVGIVRRFEKESDMVGLCISGGGAKIGFSVGVLEVMQSKGIEPVLIHGISAGSLCTAGLCFGGTDLKSCIDFMKRMLLDIDKKEDVLDPQILRAVITQITGIGKTDGLYGMKTMRILLKNLPQKVPVIKGVVGYVDLRKGDIVYVSSDGTGKEEFLDAVQASCSIPFAMQTQRTGDEVRVDGGVRDILPLKSLIDDPMNVDEIHVICHNPMLPVQKSVKKKILPVALRSVELLTNEVLQNDLKIAKLYNKLIEEGQSGIMSNKRFIRFYDYVPTDLICDMLDFNKENIKKGIDYGHRIAGEVLKDYPSKES